jgi:hypothetical protein
MQQWHVRKDVIKKISLPYKEVRPKAPIVLYVS